MDYTYDAIGQLKTAKGKEAGGVQNRGLEQLGYAYDAAGNLSYRTNNTLTQTFSVNTLNEVTTVTRSGSLHVAGTTTSPATSVTVNGQAAALYGDNTFSKGGFALVDGTNTFTAVATDSYGRVDSSSITVNLPATLTYACDLNGNLVTNGTQVLLYNDENLLVTNFVAGEWLSEFVYDGRFRRRIERDYRWNGSAWVQTNEVRFVYDGNVPLQHRDGNNAPLLTLTRGLDLSGSFQGAGGIGGLLAISEHLSLNSQISTAFYHSDGNGNVTALVNTNQIVAGRYEYDPFGNTLSISGPMAWLNTYRFSSKPVHELSGMYDFLYRWYGSEVQRWPNRDPIGELGGLNLYAYVGNNPVNRVDPLGLAYGDWYDPRSYFQEGLSGIWHVLYTGSATSSDEVYNAATEADGDYVYESGGVRGGYGGVGVWNGKAAGKGAIAGQAGLTGTWTIDDGTSLSLDLGVGLQDRGRNSLGRFTSQTLGVGGRYEFWNERDGLQNPCEGFKRSGIYGGTAENGKINKGGAHFGIEDANNVAIGINYGPVYGGLIVDPNRVLINFRDSFNILFH